MRVNDVRSALLHRELLQLIVLLLVAAAAFVGTRAAATTHRDMTIRDGEEWYRRGQQLIARGEIDSATDAFRHAIVRDRSDKRYALALARALALRHDPEGARTVLMTLRDSAPEDRDINLQLARLAAEQQDVNEAIRFYRNALYAPWPNDQADARRDVRLELVRLLLAHADTGRAQAELLALATDVPDTAASRLELGKLFAEAGDHEHALDQFQRALQLAPDNPDALSGAGQQAFQLANYTLAQKYLRQTASTGADSTTREIVELVLSNDPLASRLGSAERRRRFSADLAYSHDRLRRCVDDAAAPPDEEAAALLDDISTREADVQSLKILEQDTVEAGIELIARIERRATQRCGPATAFDEALLLIAHQHGADVR